MEVMCTSTLEAGKPDFKIGLPDSLRLPRYLSPQEDEDSRKSLNQITGVRL